ncbi:MAG: leucyl/phenylalanyl-tRNA--protein transferase [Acidimicrobiia bacterium]|nr:leucyl/phenylalanyl-tRNA--protein transferase [Acidimicrobiia bacterium]
MTAGPPDPYAPVEPPASVWELPPAATADGDGIVGVGADLEPGTILHAYRNGLFPMPLGRRGRLGWWSPDPRGVLPLDGLRVSRSLRRSLRRYEVTVDAAFEEVVRGCADPSRSGGWIDADIVAGYRRLHELRWVHSVEAWSPEGDLVGGLYGVAIGGFFAGESMFHRERDASKVALAGLVERLCAAGARLLDVQWLTPHLASLGAIAIPRATYLEDLAAAVSAPTRVWWAPELSHSHP